VHVTYPAPMYSLPTRSTLAVLTMASAASMAPTRPLVSTMPSASMAIALSFFRRGSECSTLTPCGLHPVLFTVCPTSIAHASVITGDFQMQARSFRVEDPRRGPRRSWPSFLPSTRAAAASRRRSMPSSLRSPSTGPALPGQRREITYNWTSSRRPEARQGLQGARPLPRFARG